MMERGVESGDVPGRSRDEGPQKWEEGEEGAEDEEAEKKEREEDEKSAFSDRLLSSCIVVFSVFRKGMFLTRGKAPNRL